MKTKKKKNRKSDKSGKISDAKPTEDAKNAKIIFNISNEFLDILTLSAVISKKLYRYTFSKQMNKQIYNIESRMNKLYNDLIRLNNGRLDDIIALAQAYLYMSLVYIRNETEEQNLYIGMDYLTRSLELLKGNLMKRKTILIHQRILNELATVSLMLGDITTSNQHLHNAYDIHEIYTCKKNNYFAPISITSILGNEDIEDSTILLNCTNTIILRRLADVYGTMGTKFTDKSKSILCTHLALSNDLNRLTRFANVDYITWVATAVEVYEYFITHSYFTEARNYLGAACFIIQKFCISVFSETNRDKQPRLYAPYYMHYYSTAFTIMICWAKYGIQLLRLSKNSLLRNKKGIIPSNATYSESKAVIQSWKKPVEYRFACIETYSEKFILYGDKYLQNYNDAKEVFADVIYWLEQARSYYTPDRCLIQYVRIMQDMSKAYKYLACYEVNRSEQIIIHKQRIKILEKILLLLDQEIHANMYKEIWIELVLIYSTILDIYFETVRATVAVTTEMQIMIDDILIDKMHILDSYWEFVFSRRQ